MAKRTIVGSILGSLMVVALFVHPTVIFIISLIWIALATNEFLRILSLKQIFISRVLLIGLNLLFPIIFYLHGGQGYYLVLPVIVFLYALIKREQYYLIVPFSIFTLFYLGFLPSHLLFLRVWVREQGYLFWQAGFITFFPLAFTWVNDTAAYFVGTAIGRHKLAVKISPNKTIEGFVGSIIIAIIFSVFYLKALFPHITLLLSGLIGLILSVGAQVGDLVESGFKRDAGLKDSAQVLPGHGGFLDRVDSLLFTTPIFYYILLYVIAS